MRYIAFKRAKNCPKVRQSLHDEFIVEHAYTDLFPKGYHKVEDGYEIVPEDEFQEELSKNDELQESYLKEIKKQSEARAESERARKEKIRAEEKKLRQEYEEFKKFKALKGKRLL